MTARLTELATQAAVAESCQLVEWEFASEGGMRLLRVYLEKSDGPLLVDHCAAVSERLSALLDQDSDLLPGEYRLEVSSPGLTRPLKKMEDFVRFQNRLAVIHTYAPLPVVTTDKPTPGGNRKLFKGVLQGVTDNEVLILVSGIMIHIPLRSISKAHLDFDF